MPRRRCVGSTPTSLVPAAATWTPPGSVSSSFASDASTCSSVARASSISAREGRFLALKGSPDTIILRLTDGQIIQDEPGASPRVLSFTRHDLPIDLPAIEKFRKRGGSVKWIQDGDDGKIASAEFTFEGQWRARKRHR